MLQSRTSLRENGFEAQTYSEVLKIRGESKRVTIWVKNWKNLLKSTIFSIDIFLKFWSSPIPDLKNYCYCCCYCCYGYWYCCCCCCVVVVSNIKPLKFNLFILCHRPWNVSEDRTYKSVWFILINFDPQCAYKLEEILSSHTLKACYCRPMF